MLNTGMEYDGENLREVATPDGARYRRDFDRVGRLYKLTDQFVQEPYPPARRLTPGAQLDYTSTGHFSPPAKTTKAARIGSAGGFPDMGQPGSQALTRPRMGRSGRSQKRAFMRTFSRPGPWPVLLHPGFSKRVLDSAFSNSPPQHEFRENEVGLRLLQGVLQPMHRLFVYERPSRQDRPRYEIRHTGAAQNGSRKQTSPGGIQWLG